MVLFDHMDGNMILVWAKEGGGRRGPRKLDDLAPWWRMELASDCLGPDPTPHLVLYGPPAPYSFIGEHG